MAHMRNEEPQLLAAMNRIERLIDVECDPFRNLPPQEWVRLRSSIFLHRSDTKEIALIL